MNSLFIAAVFVITALLITVVLKQRGFVNKGKNNDEKYVSKSLLTENEKIWFKRINEALPNAHIFSQVAMNQLVKAEGKAWRSAQNKINTRSIDFVILNSDLSVLLTIEIDDRSHNAEKRRVDDEKKNRALSLAGVPLLRLAATPILPTEEIKSKIVAAIAVSKQSKTATEPRIEPN